MNKKLLLSALTFIFSAQFTLAHKHNFEILPATLHTASFGCYALVSGMEDMPLVYKAGFITGGIILGGMATSQKTWSDFMWESLIIGGTAYATTTLGSAIYQKYNNGYLQRSTKYHLTPALIVAALVAKPMWNTLSPIPIALAKTIWNFKIK